MAPKDKPVEITATTDSAAEDKNKKKENNKKKDDGSIELQQDTLSEEDRELKERLETCVSTIIEDAAASSTSTTSSSSSTTATTTTITKENMITIKLQALQVIRTELRTATSSMTSVPKPLKFLRPHYTSLKGYYYNSTTTDNNNDGGFLPLLFRAKLADVLSVLAITMGAPNERECLKYKLLAMKDYDTLKAQQQYKDKLSNDDIDIDPFGSWGHEFVRTISGEIGTEYNERMIQLLPTTSTTTSDDDMKTDDNDDTQIQDLLQMIHYIIPYHIQHNAESEAIDLLMEVQRLKLLLSYNTTTTADDTTITTTDNKKSASVVDENNYERICLYLIKAADYMSDPDDLVEMLETAYGIYIQQKQYYDALRVALRMNCDMERITELLKSCNNDPYMRKQMCLLLGRHRVNYDVEASILEGTDESADQLNELIGNTNLSEYFLKLAQDLDVMDPKTPEDIYKSHLSETGGFSRSRQQRDALGNTTNVDSARANLASTFVNAFVNAGFGQDKLMIPDNEWLYKNKDHGMMSAAASLGTLLLWNVEEGLTQIDKFLYSSEDYIKAGAALAVGILSSGIRNDADPALALLSEHTEGESHIMKCAACTGLGIAYAGTAREDVMDLLVPIVESSEGGPTGMMEVSLAGLALGMIFAGKCDDAVGGTIVQRLMEATDEELDHSHAKFLCLGLAFLFMGQMEKADAMIEALRTIEHKISKYALFTLETCAYAGTGNVLKVQEMLHHCAEHLTEDADHQMIAVLGIGLITMGENVGLEMAIRSFDHLLHYCELPIKRAVPLALAVLHISNPDFAIIDQLSRLSHDPDTEMSQNAIIALGVVSAGTNNSRVAGLLRQLSDFYSKEAGHVFCVRIAQGLLHMGKGLLTINPYHSDRMLLNYPALGSTLILLHSCLDLKSTILDKSHYLLYYLASAMNPRMLITVDDSMTMVPVMARVGLAVETVGQAGKPRKITGFQTHTTPVLLSATERAELGTEEYIPVSTVMEGIVILKPNPDYKPDADDDAKDKKKK